MAIFGVFDGVELFREAVGGDDFHRHRRECALKQNWLWRPNLARKREYQSVDGILNNALQLQDAFAGEEGPQHVAACLGSFNVSKTKRSLGCDESLVELVCLLSFLVRVDVVKCCRIGEVKLGASVTKTQPLYRGDLYLVGPKANDGAYG